MFVMDVADKKYHQHLKREKSVYSKNHSFFPFEYEDPEL